MPKAAIVGVMVSAHNPHCDVSYEFAKGVLELPDEDRLWEQEFVVSTIADDLTELALNRLAVERGVTVYYLRALRSGTVGRLVRVRPRVDACFECLGHYHEGGDTRAVVIPAERDEVITRECGQPVLASSAADLAVVGGIGAREILFDARSAEEVNQWVWTSAAIPGHPQLEAPFSRMTASLKPHPSCAICGGGTPRRVLLPTEVRNVMLELARAHAPNETGGILIGRIEEDRIIVLAASDAGPLAIHEPTRFERDGAYCQEFLGRKAAELGSGVDYVGEWHSHPASSADPSLRDTKSFVEIAADPNVLSTAPVLVIVAPRSETSVEWSATIFPVGGVGRTVPLDESR